MKRESLVALATLAGLGWAASAGSPASAGEPRPTEKPGISVPTLPPVSHPSAPETSTPPPSRQGAPASGRLPVPDPSKSYPISFIFKAPEAFKEMGDIVGISPEILTALGLKDGDLVELRLDGGKGVGAEVKAYGNDTKGIYAKKILRDALGVDEGEVKLTVMPLAWPSGDPAPGVVRFRGVTRPPKQFLRYGKAVGVSLAKMREMNAVQGQKAILTAPNGKQDIVGVYLLDRNPDTIAIRQSLRQVLEIESENSEITLEPQTGKVQVSETGSSESPESSPE